MKELLFVEINQEELTHEHKKNALPVLLFLTLKRDGTVIKGRACADGRPQHVWTDKQGSASPTIAVEALFCTIIMDATEGRDVTTFDLPGHFLQTDMEGGTLLQIEGALASLLVKLDQKLWKKDLRYQGKNLVIYVKCDKAIYGTVTGVALSFKKLIGHLVDWGFEMNP